MLCQSSRKDKFHNVETLQTSARILQLAIQDHTMQVRLAGVTDLVADEGKYHLICYRKFLRETSKCGHEESSSATDACFQNVVEELRTGLA